MLWVIVCLSLIIFVLCFKLVVKLRTGWCSSQTCLKGKTVIVTGANAGLGFETSLDFSKRGARVILACRNEQKAREALQKIISETGNDDVRFEHLDLSSFSSVRRFVQRIEMEEERLDILVNNAGFIMSQDVVTADGLQDMYQTNYFSPALLTFLLLGMLKKTKGRIINVSSVAAWYTIMTKKHMKDFKRFVPSIVMYPRSKLCQIMFTIELAKLLKPSGVTVYSLHPGIVKTNLLTNLPLVFRAVLEFFERMFFKSAVEGAQTTIHCAVSKGIEEYSGEHFHDCKKVGRYWNAGSKDLRKKLWVKTMDVLGIQEDSLFVQ